MSDGEVNNFVIINLGKYFKSTKEKFYSKLNKKPDVIKVIESLYNFLKTPDELEKCAERTLSSSSDNFICHYNVKILNIFCSRIATD